MRQFGSSIRTQLEGLKLADEPQLRKSLASTYLLAARALAASQPDKIGERLELLQDALALDPENEYILSSFAAITAKSGPAAEQARETLQSTLELGKAAGNRASDPGLDCHAARSRSTGRLSPQPSV